MIAIAIDGPSGAGKSTIARAIARKFGFLYVDTGAVYRAVGLAVLREGLCPRDQADVAALLPSLRIAIEHTGGEQAVILNGENVNESIRTPEISMAASDCSKWPSVRAFLLDLQRRAAVENNVVMDGRDIGTVVLPHAQIKIFLTADPADRARRRYKELIGRGLQVDYQEVLADVNARDEQDSGRAVAPLKPADDAVIVDTTGNTLERSIAVLTQLAEDLLLPICQERRSNT